MRPDIRVIGPAGRWSAAASRPSTRAKPQPGLQPMPPASVVTMQAITAPGGTTCWHRFSPFSAAIIPPVPAPATGRWCWPAWPGPDVADPSTRLDYALGRWAGAESIAASRLDLVRRAGLPPRAAQMMMLFHHADCHVFSTGRAAGSMPSGRPRRWPPVPRSSCVPSPAWFTSRRPTGRKRPGLAGPFIEVLSRSRPDATILFKMVTAMLERLKRVSRTAMTVFSNRPVPSRPDEPTQTGS